MEGGDVDGTDKSKVKLTKTDLRAAPPKPEKLHFLPQDLFIRDNESELKAPAAVKGIPHYKFEQVLHLLPLLERHGEIRGLTAITKPGKGQEAFIFRVRGNDLDIVVKLFYGVKFPKALAGQLTEASYREIPKVPDRYLEWANEEIATGRWKESPLEYLKYMRFWDQSPEAIDQRKTAAIRDFSNPTPFSQENVSAAVFQEAAGQNVGNYLAPEFVEKPLSIWTYEGKTVAVAYPYLEGEAVNVGRVASELLSLNMDDERVYKILTGAIRDEELTPQEQNLLVIVNKYRNATNNLEAAGVDLDTADPAHNAIVTQINGVPKVRLIDLRVDRSDLDKPLKDWSK